jgi:hypothetical protein
MQLDDGALLGATENIERAGDQELKLGGAAEELHHTCRKPLISGRLPEVQSPAGRRTDECQAW